jgi:hypothetical protein
MATGAPVTGRDAASQPAMFPAVRREALGGPFRAGASFLVGLGGLVLVTILFSPSPWCWLLWIGVGAAVGALARRGALVWVAWLSVLVYNPVSGFLGLPGDHGPFWMLGVLVGIALVSVGYAAGTSLAWRRAPWSGPAQAFGRLPRFARRVLVGLVLILLLAGIAYTGYVGAVGSDRFVHTNLGVANCENPRHGFGWPYEAVNYDVADDRRLEAANPDMARCSSQGVIAGDEVVTGDGVHLAGFYIPAADGASATAPTLLLVPGWVSNKSDVLKYAVPFHQSYNVLTVDVRAVGRSTHVDTTMGLRERLDVEAMVDWLERTKHPRWIGLMGVSQGGATAIAAAVSDPRIRALILDSMHAHEVTTIGTILETEYGHPSLPGSWAIVAGASLRLGTDVTSVDPANTLPRLGDRPVLLIHGTADIVDRPADSAEINFHAALEAGVPVELHYCLGGSHGRVIDHCPGAWSSWALSFLARVVPDEGADVARPGAADSPASAPTPAGGQLDLRLRDPS